MLQTSEEAREYFKPLTYDILTEKNFNKLIAILEEHLGKWNRKVLEDRDKYERLLKTLDEIREDMNVD